MCSLINKQLLLTAYAYLFIMEQQKAQQGSEALQLQVESRPTLAGPSYDNAGPSYNNAGPSNNVAGPSYDNATKGDKSSAPKKIAGPSNNATKEDKSSAPKKIAGSSNNATKEDKSSARLQEILAEMRAWPNSGKKPAGADYVWYNFSHLDKVGDVYATTKETMFFMDTRWDELQKMDSSVKRIIGRVAMGKIVLGWWQEREQLKAGLKNRLVELKKTAKALPNFDLEKYKINFGQEASIAELKEDIDVLSRATVKRTCVHCTADFAPGELEREEVCTLCTETQFDFA